jgi:outer membrane protein assembly factor BamB
MVPDDSISAGLALHWSELEHVTWKTSIPHSGLSTPVIQDGKVWLTTATLEGHESFVLCVDATTGKMLLNKRLFETANPEPLGNKVNGYASPSPVAELGHVYINFGSYGTACLDATSFTVLWKRTDLPCRHYRGPGSSPILFRDLLIVTMDGVDQQYVVALNKATGETVWKTDRTTRWDDLDAQGNPDREGDKRKAYSTPLVASVDGTPLLISVGSTAVFAYDPFTGREIWKFQHKDFSSSISPVFGHDLAFIGSGFGKAEFFAMRVNGQGPLTEEAIVWKAKKGMPRTPSPLLVDDLVYTLADNGTVTCMDALTGQEIWQERLEGQFAASLLHAKGCIYCCNQEGQTTVLQAGRSFKVLATNRLDFGCMASPAVADNALFLRTKSYLYRIDK